MAKKKYICDLSLKGFDCVCSASVPSARRTPGRTWKCANRVCRWVEYKEKEIVPFDATPILTGKEAQRFMAEEKRNRKKVASKKDIEGIADLFEALKNPETDLVECINCKMVWRKTADQKSCPGCKSNAYKPFKEKSLEELYKPIQPSIPYPKSNSNSPCDMCSNNPKNGGTGVCWCTLGGMTWTC